MSFVDAFSQFFLRLQDNWIWLMGILLMGEPLVDYLWDGYRTRADQYVSRKARTRTAWAIVIFSAFVACFLAFKDEAERAKTAVDLVATITGQRDEARRQLDELAARKKDRSKFIEALQKFYADGSALNRSLLRMDITDDQINMLSDDISKWGNSVISWLSGNLSAAAASRFLDRSDSMVAGATINPGHPQEMVIKRNNLVSFLVSALKNIDSIMKSDQWDPP